MTVDKAFRTAHYEFMLWIKHYINSNKIKTMRKCVLY